MCMFARAHTHTHTHTHTGLHGDKRALRRQGEREFRRRGGGGERERA
jgi:hypothetical protein